MKNIKVRCWDKWNSKFCYFDISNPTEADTEGLGIFAKVEKQLFTGLTDKLGKEIFEGDILQEDTIYRIFKIEWDEVEARFDMVFCKGENGYEGQKRHIIDSFKMEVIGNIYENPDLLKD